MPANRAPDDESLKRPGLEFERAANRASHRMKVWRDQRIGPPEDESLEKPANKTPQSMKVWRDRRIGPARG
jgi:hypothetical protein